MIEQTLFHTLRELLVLLQVATQDALRPFHLTPEQYDTLQLLADSEGMRMGDLTRRVLTDNSKMTRIVDFLEENGWAKRGPDPEDRRAQLVTITPKGDEHRAAAAIAHQQALQQWMSPLDESQKGTLQQLAHAVSEQIKQTLNHSQFKV